MSQIVTASFAAQSAVASKSIDYAFVIAGWPTVYTVSKGNYPLVGPFANFSSIQQWADIPAAVGESVRRRPEEGGMAIGQLDVSILDKVFNGSRALTALASRDSLLSAWSAAFLGSGIAPPVLSQDHDNSTTTVTIAGQYAATFPQNGTIYAGLECIKYAGYSNNADGTSSFAVTNRGYLLTSATPHLSGSPVYSFMPSIFRRKAYLYKGYQNLGLDQWAPAFGGVIGGTKKEGALTTFSVFSTIWDLYLDGNRCMFGGISLRNTPTLGQVSTASDMLSGDLTMNLEGTLPSAISNGHYLLKVGDHWMAIAGTA